MNQKSPHILSSSANLLGFSFFVLSSVKALNLPQGNFTDKIIVLCIFIFAVSSMFSFSAIRSHHEETAKRYETIAEYGFMIGLFFVVFISSLLAFDFIVLA